MVCTKEVGKPNVCRFYIPISPNIMESRQNHFWYALIAPPLSPPFPPNSVPSLFVVLLHHTNYLSAVSIRCAAAKRLPHAFYSVGGHDDRCHCQPT